jgi:hypothetical protein
MAVGGQHHALAALNPRTDTVLILQEAGWGSGRSGWPQKMLLIPGFEPPTAQPVTIRYTHYANPANTPTTNRL